MRASERFTNIESCNAGRKGHRLIGYTRSGRAFHVVVVPCAPSAARWRARAFRETLTMRDELRGESLAHISAQLAEMD